MEGTIPTSAEMARIIRTGSPADIVDALRCASVSRSPGMADTVRSCLTDQRPAVRNAAALALLDLGDPRARSAIGDAIRHPGTASQSGTLVWVLHEMRGKLTLADIELLALEGSYEAKCMACGMIDDGLLDLDGAMPPEGIMARFEEMAEGMDDAGELARTLLDAMQGRQPGPTLQ